MVDITPNPVPAKILAQPDQYTGRLSVSRVQTDDGYILLEYGGYGPNSGPIDVIGFRPSDRDVKTFYSQVPDEEIRQYRELNNGIWSCNTDPRNRDNPRIATNDGGTWRLVETQVPGKGVAVHSFDIAQISTGELFVDVARNLTDQEMATWPGVNPDVEYNTALSVWKSIDGGVTWTEEFADLKANDGYYRAYGIGKIGDDIYISASDGTGHWRRDPVLGWRPKVALTLDIYQPPLWTFDGFVSAGVLFRKASDGTLYRTVIADIVYDEGPEGFLYAKQAQLYYGTTKLGFFPTYYNWSGIVTENDGIIMADKYNRKIYQVVVPQTLVIEDVTPALPLVEAQPTPSGRRISVSPFTNDHRIPIGYGDDGANTGPVSVLLWDPETDEVENVLSDQDTEMFRHYRRFDDGTSWTTSEDPRGSNTGFLCTNYGGTWHRVTVDIPGLTVAVHLHDVAKINGIIHICGSRDTLPSENGGVRPGDEGTAIVWQSSDNGQTWTESVAFHGNGISEWNRFFSFGRVNDKLVVFTNGYLQPELTHGYYVMSNGVWSAKKTNYESAPSTMYQNMVAGPNWFYRAAPYEKLTLDSSNNLVRLSSESDGAVPLAYTNGRYTYMNTSGKVVDSYLGVIDRSAQSASHGPNGELYLGWNLTRILKVTKQ